MGSLSGLLSLSWTLLVLVPLLLVQPPLTSSLEDDLFYFTSFANVKEWSQVYNTCRTDFNYQYKLEEVHYLHLENEGGLEPPTLVDPLDPNITLFLSLNENALPNTLSPIEIKHSQTMCLTNSTRPSCARAMKLQLEPGKIQEPVMKIYNNPPPPLGSYSVSYGFQKNKECATTTDYAPCFVNPQFGKTRGVVLTANRQRLREIREQFSVEDPNQFVSIVDGGSTNERKFSDAIFMGSSEPVNCKTERTSHIVDGKCYPMEIYMYFVDETIPTMAMSTILVVPVEFGENENPKLRPVVNAVNRLYDEERIFLPKHDHIIRDQRMFHHTGPSTFFVHPHNDNDTDYFYIPSSIDAENLISAQMDHFERVLTYRAKTGFIKDKFFSGRAYEKRLVETAAFSTGALEGVLFQGEDKENPHSCTPSELVPDDPGEPTTTCPPQKESSIPPLVDSQTSLTDKENENLPGITVAKLRVLRYLVSESYNREVDYFRSGHPEKNQIEKLKGHWPGEKEGTPIAAQTEFTALVQKFLESRDNVNSMLVEKNPDLSYKDKISVFLNIRKEFDRIKDHRGKMFAKLPSFIQAVCQLAPKCTEWTEKKIKEDDTWSEVGKLPRNDFGAYPQFLRHSMDLGQDLARNRIQRANNKQNEVLKDTYLEMGFQESEQLNFEQHDEHYLGKINLISTNFTFGNVYTNDKYVHRQLRNFLSSHAAHHILKYHEYKKTGPRKASLKYPKQQILLGNLGMSKKRFEELEKMEPPSLTLKNDFQVSWLIPKGGGYYRYKGSSPVPPCYGAEEMIVFRKPIKASREQIQALTTIPTSRLKSRDIWNTFGIRTPKRQTNNKVAKIVYFDPRNHQFLVGDGFHQNSVLAYQERKKKKSGGGSNGANFVVYLLSAIVSIAGWLFN